AFQASLKNQLLLVLAALAAGYIVLGILHESYRHPPTILSTWPSAGIGALLALKLTGVELSIIAMIGVLLLVGIVKKNAMMVIAVALERERAEGLDPREAIHQAAVLRFRPILMTTMAAILGALPLALGFGDGAELRQPLGISIIGGLIVSQVLALYSTPVMYIYLDRFRRRDRDRPSRLARALGSAGPAPAWRPRALPAPRARCAAQPALCVPTANRRQRTAPPRLPFTGTPAPSSRPPPAANPPCL